MIVSAKGRARPIRLITIVASLLLANVAMVAASASAVVATGPPIFIDTFHPEAGPRGAVTIMGDSVMLGSSYEMPGYGPSLAEMMLARGWGPVRTKSGVGFQAGLNVGNNPGANLSQFVRNQRASGWDTPIYIVNVGGNDILGCSGRQSCAETDIRGLLDVIGADREVWWSKITMTRQSDQDAWNNALLAVAAERPNLKLWDWPSIRITNEVPIGPDNIHLPDSSAYRKRSALMADDITTRLGVSQQVGGPAVAPVAVGAPSEFVPLPLDRVIDSRSTVTPLAAGGVLQVDLSAKVPQGATAVSINLTAVNPSLDGFLTAYPCGGTPPVTSNVNYLAGQIRPNHVVVGLGAGATLCVLSSAPTDVIVDLQGAFVANGGTRLTPMTPTRIADTRETGRADPLMLTAPAGAEGLVLNVTGVGSELPGFMVVYPCDRPIPATSNLNFVAGAAVAGSVYVEVGRAGTVCVHANTPIDMVVDLHGTFSAGGQLRFQAAAPQRMVDTRTGLGGWRGQVGVGQQIEVAVAPPEAQAVTGNITIIAPGTSGFQTAFRCGIGVPPTSSVNADRAQIAANSFTVSSTASMCVRSSVGAHLIVDTTGWWVA
ncbi:MAG: hypothetical protein ABIR32_06100 [Ilumatobacteraceae bacterium]